MLLSSYLDAKTIYYEVNPKTKIEVYRDMVARICHHYPLPTCGQELVDLILTRDAESSTAYGTGIAVPHIRMEGFNDTLISMCLLANPIDYDGTKVSLIVLIITNKSSSKLYLNIVASLLKLSKDEGAMASLREAKDGGNIISILKTIGVSIKESLTIADIMINNPVTMRPEATLRELGVAMHEKCIANLPVVDANNRYVGEVDVLNLLKVGIPDYMLMMDHLGFMASFEPLEQLFEKEDIITVKEIMSKDEELLKSTDSIIDAVFEMIQHKKRFFSVVDDGKLVGVVTAMDVFKKVFKS